MAARCYTKRRGEPCVRPMFHYAARSAAGIFKALAAINSE